MIAGVWILRLEHPEEKREPKQIVLAILAGFA